MLLHSGAFMLTSHRMGCNGVSIFKHVEKKDTVHAVQRCGECGKLEDTDVSQTLPISNMKGESVGQSGAREGSLAAKPERSREGRDSVGWLTGHGGLPASWTSFCDTECVGAHPSQHGMQPARAAVGISFGIALSCGCPISAAPRNPVRA